MTLQHTKELEKNFGAAQAKQREATQRCEQLAAEMTETNALCELLQTQAHAITGKAEQVRS